VSDDPKNDFLSTTLPKERRPAFKVVTTLSVESGALLDCPVQRFQVHISTT
jgi:hypothetical protein